MGGTGTCRQLKMYAFWRSVAKSVGDTPLWYEFTLIEYHVYIDEVSWLIFSVLGGASENEFEPHFFKTLNQNRKDTWDFQKLAWLTSKEKYDVARPYEDFVLPIFDTYIW